MKKNEIIAMQNRLEYLKDKVQRQEKRIVELQDGNRELNTIACIMIMEMCLAYGGEEHTITIPRQPGIHKEWDTEIEVGEGFQTIRMRKKEKE